MQQNTLDSGKSLSTLHRLEFRTILFCVSLKKSSFLSFLFHANEISHSLWKTMLQPQPLILFY